MDRLVRTGEGSTFPPELSALLQASGREKREAAWAAFVGSYSQLLLHTARASGGDYDDAMDAYAWMLEQLRADDLHRLRAYTSERQCKFTTWLVVVARRLCLDHHRHRYGRADGPDPVQKQALAVRRRLVDLVTEDVDPEALTHSDVGNPEAEFVANELDGTLAAAVGSLAPRDRLLIKLRFDDDLSAREIAQVMGFPSTFHVYRQLKRLLATLRTSLQQQGVDTADR